MISHESVVFPSGKLPLEREYSPAAAHQLISVPLSDRIPLCQRSRSVRKTLSGSCWDSVQGQDLDMTVLVCGYDFMILLLEGCE